MIMPKLVPSSTNIQFWVNTPLQLRINRSSKGPDELTNLPHSLLAQLFYSNFTEALQFGFPEKDFRFSKTWVRPNGLVSIPKTVHKSHLACKFIPKQQNVKDTHDGYNKSLPHDCWKQKGARHPNHDHSKQIRVSNNIPDEALLHPSPIKCP